MLASSFSNTAFAPFLQLLVAMLFGMILGIERFLAGRTAGPRTYGLVSMGACLFTLLSVNAISHYPANSKVDPIPIVSAIVSGIGFIGAGLIIFRKSKISGLTTAAGIWVSGAIGIAVGFGNFLLAFFTTFLTLFLFSTMWYLENDLRKLYRPDNSYKKDEM